MKYIVFLLILLFPLEIVIGQQFNAFLFTKTDGWHHESIREGVTAIENLGKKNHFNVDWNEREELFTDESLEKYDVIIFLNTTLNILNEDQQKAMENFIRSGKGYVGIHAAADTEYDWPWYRKLVGRMFVVHPTIQTAVLEVEKADFPGMATTPAKRIWTDEWYQYGPEEIEGLTYVMSVDEKSYNAETKRDNKINPGMGDFHPIAWYHNYDGGRAYYTGLGHLPETFSDPIFLDQLFGAIWWAATGKGLE